MSNKNREISQARKGARKIFEARRAKEQKDRAKAAAKTTFFPPSRPRDPGQLALLAPGSFPKFRGPSKNEARRRGRYALGEPRKGAT
jgi:hypothetical protein